MTFKQKLLYRKLIRDKERLIKFIYKLQDRFADMLEDNTKLKYHFRGRYKQFQEESFNNISKRIDERERDIGILFRKSELLDDKTFRGFDSFDLDSDLEKELHDLARTYEQYSAKWKSWDLTSICYGKNI